VDAFENGMKAYSADIKVIEQKPIALCQSHSIFLRVTASAFSQTMDIDAVLAPGTPTTYAAIYKRFKGAAENPDALKAIESICPTDRQTAA
jgi:hypothetical protein